MHILNHGSGWSRKGGRYIESITHYPESLQGADELKKRVAVVHAQAVARYIDHMPCPKDQKLKLYDEIIKACRNKR